MGYIDRVIELVFKTWPYVAGANLAAGGLFDSPPHIYIGAGLIVYFKGLEAILDLKQFTNNLKVKRRSNSSQLETKLGTVQNK